MNEQDKKRLDSMRDALGLTKSVACSKAGRVSVEIEFDRPPCRTEADRKYEEERETKCVTWLAETGSRLLPTMMAASTRGGNNALGALASGLLIVLSETVEAIDYVVGEGLHQALGFEEGPMADLLDQVDGLVKRILEANGCDGDCKTCTDDESGR